jgi:hypothetical protein
VARTRTRQLSEKVLVHPPPSYNSYCSYCSYCSYMAALATHRTSERQPCRGANSLRPHPDGPPALFGRRPSPPHGPHTHFLAGGHHTSHGRHTRTFWPEAITLRTAATHAFWPEAIAARWSCGPHVTPASNRRRRCRAGVDDAHPQHGTSEMCRLCCDHFLLFTFPSR